MATDDTSGPADKRGWFELPSGSNPGYEREAALTFRVVRTMLVVVVLLLTVAHLDPRNEVLNTVIVYTPIVAALIAADRLVKAGRARVAAVLVTTMLWLFVCGVLLFFGGLARHNAVAFIVVLMIAGTTLGARAAGVFAGLGVLATSALAAVESAGYLPEPLVPASLWNSYLAVVATLLIAAVLFSMSTRSHHAALKRAEEYATQVATTRELNAQRARQGEALGALGEAALLSADSSVLASQASRVCAAVLGNARILIARVAPGEEELVLLADSAEPNLGARDSVPLPDGVPYLLAASGELQRSRAATEIPDSTRTAWHLSDVRGGVSVTVPGRNRTLGVLVALPRVEGSFDAGDRLFLGTVAGMLGSAAERREAEQRAVQAQKMEIVGKLAGGVAHDFNNLLSVMTGVSSLLRSSAAAESGVPELLDDLDAATLRAELLTQQLLAFGRARLAEPEPVVLEDVFRSTTPLLRRLVGDEFVLEYRTGVGGTRVLASRAAIEQLVLNLVVNARDAMPGGGVIELRTGGDVDDGTVWFEVLDRGQGIDASVQGRMFEPFFTTKATGTGLGLSTVRDIAARYDADVQVRPREGGGTAFRLTFVAEGPVNVVSEADFSSARYSIRGCCVLLVEDDEMVRRNVRRMLIAEGVEVAEANEGQAALTLLGERVFDLVLTDVRMPGMTGFELSERAAARGVSTPFLFMSGHTDAVSESAFPLLQKPFGREVLNEAVGRACLGGLAAAIDTSARA